MKNRSQVSLLSDFIKQCSDIPSINRNMCTVLLTLFVSKEDLISREILDLLNLEDFHNLSSSICNHVRRRKSLDILEEVIMLLLVMHF